MIETARSNVAMVKNKPFKVIVCSVTLVAFLCNMILFDPVWAAGTPSTLTGRGVERAGGSGSSKELRPDTFALPEYLGQIKEACRGSSGKTVIHIQDAHCNYAAQHKIAEIIEYFNREYGVNTLNLEGGARDYDISIFTRIADKKTREKAADYFVKEGLVNGAEYFAINNPEKAALWGVEDVNLYIDNLKTYRNSLKHKDEVDKYLAALSHILNNLKTKIYSPELLELDKKYSQYKAGTLEFKDYLTYLVQVAKGKAIDSRVFTNIYLLGRALTEEGRVDFKKANDQRDDLIDKLQKKLSKNSLEELVAKTVEFRSDRISQKEFYAYLANKAKIMGIELSVLPDLQRYIAYISMYDAIDKMKVMEEMDRLEVAVKDALYQDDNERELGKLSKNLAILKNIFNISLTREDYRYYIDNERSFDVAGYMSFIEREAPLYKITTRPDKTIADLDGYRRDISKFYEYSLKRDAAFLENLKFYTIPDPLSAIHDRVALLITGGFHTGSLCEKFKKGGISYISIMPNFRNDEGYRCPYFKVLSGKDTMRIKDVLPSLLTSSLAPPDQLCPAMVKAMENAAGTLATPIGKTTPTPIVIPPAPAASAAAPGAVARVPPEGKSPGIAATAVNVIAPREVTYSDQNHGFSLQERRLTQAELLSGIIPETISWTAKPSSDLMERNMGMIVEIAKNNVVAKGMDLSARSIRDVADEPISFVIGELVRNAFDAYARINTGWNSIDGPVRLRILKDNGNVIIEVSDSGIGFSRIVNEYNELDVESNPAGTEYVLLQGGRQMGLKWAKILAQLHGGKLEILSPGTDGFGTTIRIVVPESAIKVNISDGKLAVPAEAIPEYAPLAPPEEKPETASNFPNNFRMGRELTETLLSTGVKTEEANRLIDEYHRTYIGSIGAAVSMVQTLQGLLDFGLPPVISEFFSSRNIWEKSQQGLILQAAKSYFNSGQQTVFQTSPYAVLEALMFLQNELGITDPAAAHSRELILNGTKWAVLTMIAIWIGVKLVKLVKNILGWRENRRQEKIAEIDATEKAIIEAQAEARVNRQKEEDRVANEALDAAYTGAGKILERYIKESDTLTGKIHKIQQDIQRDDISPGLRERLNNISRQLDYTLKQFNDLFQNGYAALGRVLATATDISGSDHRKDRKILTDALISFGKLDGMFRRVNAVLELNEEQFQDNLPGKKDIQLVKKITFQAGENVRKLCGKYPDAPKLCARLTGVLPEKDHWDIHKEELNGGWSQLECQKVVKENGWPQIACLVTFIVLGESALIKNITDLRPEGKRDVSIGKLLKEAIAVAKDSLNSNDPDNRIFVLGKVFKNLDLVSDGFRRLPTDEQGIAALDPALGEFLEQQDVKAYEPAWYYPNARMSQVSAPAVTPATPAAPVSLKPVIEPIAGAGVSQSDTSPSAAVSFFDYTRSYNKSGYPEDSFRFLAYSLGVFGWDRIQEMNQAFYEIGKLSETGIIIGEEKDALRDDHLALVSKLQDIRCIKPFIDPKRGPDYEAKAREMVKEALSGRAGYLAAVDALIARLRPDPRLKDALEVIGRFRVRMVEYFDELAARYAVLAALEPAAAPATLASTAPVAAVPGQAERQWQSRLSQVQERELCLKIITIIASFGYGTNDATDLMSIIISAKYFNSVLLRKLDKNDPSYISLASSISEFAKKADRLVEIYRDADAMIALETKKSYADLAGGKLFGKKIDENSDKIEGWIDVLADTIITVKAHRETLSAKLPELKDILRGDGDEVLKHILECSKTTENILTDRIQTIRGEISDDLVDMNEIIRGLPSNLVCTNRGKFKTKRFRFEPSAPGHPIFVRGSRLSLISLVSNLAANAFKYAGKHEKTEEDGTIIEEDATITLGIKEKGGRVIITVSDNGVGMDAELRQDVMGAPFFTTGGTGIGINECHAIVAGHKGTLECHSEPGVITTFTVDLPEAAVSAEPVAAKSAPAEPSPKISAASIFSNNLSYHHLSLSTKLLVEKLSKDRPYLSANILLKLLELKEITYDKDKEYINSWVEKLSQNSPYSSTNIPLKLLELKEITYDKDKEYINSWVEKLSKDRPYLSANILLKLLELKEITYDKDKEYINSWVEKLSQGGVFYLGANILLKLLELKEITYDKDKEYINSWVEKLSGNWPDSSANILLKLLELKEITYDKDAKDKLNSYIEKLSQSDPDLSTNILLKLLELKEITYDKDAKDKLNSYMEKLSQDSPYLSANILLKLLELKEITYDKDKEYINSWVEKLSGNAPDLSTNILLKLLELKEITYDKDAKDKLNSYMEKLSQDSPYLSANILLKLLELKEITYDKDKEYINSWVEKLSQNSPYSSTNIPLKLLELKEITYDKDKEYINSWVEKLSGNWPDSSANILLKLLELKEITYNKDKEYINSWVEKLSQDSPDSSANILLKLLELKEITYDKDAKDKLNSYMEKLSQDSPYLSANILLKLLKLTHSSEDVRKGLEIYSPIHDLPGSSTDEFTYLSIIALSGMAEGKTLEDLNPLLKEELNKFISFKEKFRFRNVSLDEHRRIDIDEFFNRHSSTLACLVLIDADMTKRILSHESSAEPRKFKEFLDQVSDILYEPELYPALRVIAKLDSFDSSYYERMLMLSREYVRMKGITAFNEFIRSKAVAGMSMKDMMNTLGIEVLNMLSESIGVKADIRSDVSDKFYLPFASHLVTARNYIKTSKPEYSNLFNLVVKAAFEDDFDLLIHKGDGDIAANNTKVKKDIEDNGMNYEVWTDYAAQVPLSVESLKRKKPDYPANLDIASTSIHNLMKTLNEKDKTILIGALKNISIKYTPEALTFINGNGREDPEKISQGLKKGFEALDKTLAFLERKYAEITDVKEAIFHVRQDIEAIDRLPEFTAANISIRRMDKNRLGYSLFMGDFVQCCMAMSSNLYPHEMLTHLIDDAIQVVEVIDNDTGLPIALSWNFLGKDNASGKTYLVLDNLEINDSYKGMTDEIREALIRYNTSYARDIGADGLLAGADTHTKVPIKGEPQTLPIKKIGPYLDDTPYYLESLKGGKFRILAGDLQAAAPQPFKAEVVNPSNVSEDLILELLAVEKEAFEGGGALGYEYMKHNLTDKDGICIVIRNTVTGEVAGYITSLPISNSTLIPHNDPFYLDYDKRPGVLYVSDIAVRSSFRAARLGVFDLLAAEFSRKALGKGYNVLSAHTAVSAPLTRQLRMLGMSPVRTEPYWSGEPYYFMAGEIKLRLPRAANVSVGAEAGLPAPAAPAALVALKVSAQAVKPAAASGAAAPATSASTAPGVAVPDRMNRLWPESNRYLRIITILASFSHGTNKDTNLIDQFGSIISSTKAFLHFWEADKVQDRAELIEAMRKFIKTADRLMEAHSAVKSKFMSEKQGPEEDLAGKDLRALIYESRDDIEAWFVDMKDAYEALREYRKALDTVLPELKNKIISEDEEMWNGMLKCFDPADSMLADRIMAIKGEISSDLVDMGEIIKNLPSYLIRKAGGNYAEARFLFETPASGGPIFVRGNRRSLISLVSNLVANAVKYAGKHKKTLENGTIIERDAIITLGVRTEAGRVIITVSDNGVGMDSERMKRTLSEPFSTTGGTGIGLNECEIVATNHKGYITGRSEPNVGTTFTVDLPEVGTPAPVIAPPVPMPVAPLAIAESQVAAAKTIISELPQGTADIIVMPGSETHKSQQFALGKDVDRKLEKDYGQHTVPMNYVFTDDVKQRQADIEKAVKQALSQLISRMKDGDKTARVMVYISPDDEQFMKNLLGNADLIEYKSRFTVVKEENIPKDGLIDEVMHIILAKGLLNYQRYENDEYGQGARLSEESKRKLADFIKTLIANPEAIDFDQDPGIINKILNGSINLRIRPIDFKEAQAWKKMQDAVLKSL